MQEYQPEVVGVMDGFTDPLLQLYDENPEPALMVVELPQAPMLSENGLKETILFTTADTDTLCAATQLVDKLRAVAK